MYTLRKTSVLTVALALVLALLFGAFAMFGGRPAGAETDGPDVEPVLIPKEVNNNPTCADQGYAREFKIEGIELDNGPYNDEFLNVTISNLLYSSEGEAVQFDWASNIGVDAVLVKASPSANAYIYDPPGPEQLADDGLIAPDGKEISHISFCYDLNLEVSKTAQTSVDRTYTWTIDKSADQTELTLEPGQQSDINYTITLTSSPEDSNHAVEGVITITNPDPDNAATVTGVTDQITGGINAEVTCEDSPPPPDEPFPFTIPAGGTSECHYSAALPNGDNGRTNTATVTTSGAVGGGSGTKPVSFENPTVNDETDEIANVEDSFKGSLGQALANDPQTKVFTYKRTVSFDECGKYDVDNTASFTTNDTPTTGEDTWNVDVTVLCKVTVKKTTNGVVNPTKSIEFVLTGPGLPAGGVKLNTLNDQDGILDFGYKLLPGEKYTVCENPVPAGWTSLWKLNGTIVTPYNPNATDSPPQDLGVKCFDFSVLPAEAPDPQLFAFEVDNSHPGGDPRTIGYWKNWNKCTSGNQSKTAAKNGGAGAGFYLVEDLLPQTLSHGDASDADDYKVTSCTQAVKILSKQDQTGKSMASDAAYELAAQLLAAKFNLAAGAETCPAVQTADTNGQLLLDKINFTGTGTYLKTSSIKRTEALNLAATLDKYNNGNLCV